MSEFKFEIEEKLLVLSENDKGWTKELNRVSFNGRLMQGFNHALKLVQRLFLISCVARF